MTRRLIATVALSAVTTSAHAQTNYDEAKVPKYEMIDPLVMADGAKVADRTAWRKRRAEIQALFEEHVYGKTPRTRTVRFEVFDKGARALGGKAIRRQVRAHFTSEADGPGMDILIYLPARARKPVPVVLAMNFKGNHSINNDPGIRLPQTGTSKKTSRGSRTNRWAVDLMLSRGYGLATIWYGDVEPDRKDGLADGVRGLYPKPAPSGWAAVGAWAWGLSRAVDYFETDAQVDAERVIVMGHSRLGKTSLWAGASDERFAMVISNNSGCGGAALSKRAVGETVARINRTFPHWFCANFKKYDNNEAALPLDQHMLLAMIAPRPLYVASAEGDRWADPRGEFLAAKGASPVYRLLGTDGLPAEDMPGSNKPSHGRIGYHIRTGKHDVTEYDWKQYLDFADKNVK